MGLLNKKKSAPKTETKKPAAKTTAAKKSSEDEIAAMAAAIFLHTQQQVHDLQDYKMTIQRVDIPYSPWSSKNHMMRKWPRKK